MLVGGGCGGRPRPAGAEAEAGTPATPQCLRMGGHGLPEDDG